MAFSIRFSATRRSSSRSPVTTTGPVGVELDFHPHFARERGQRVGDMARRLRQIDRRLRADVLLLFDARKRQQIVDQARHAAPLFAHDGEKLVARPRIVARRTLQRLDEAEHRGERRAQFVAGVGDEVGAHALDAPRLRSDREASAGSRRLRRTRRPAAPRRLRTAARSARVRSTAPSPLRRSP